MRICIVYDCLYPYTVGGAERWYRALAERLAAAGHEVSYLTLRQWPRPERPELPGVDVVAVGPPMALYTGSRRRVGPPLVFGLGVLAHLIRHGRRYDAVHTASFPYFSLLAAAAARPLGRYGLFVDWHELWTREYWRDYLGRFGGSVGWRVQRRCVRVRQRAFCFSRLHERRLREEGFRGQVTVLEGEYAGALDPAEPLTAEPLVVFAGRHIPEKRVPAVVAAVAEARKSLPDLRAKIFGDGPDRPAVLREIDELGVGDAVEAPGFVPAGEVEESLRKALCLLLPSRREGYGLVVVEASAAGTPSIVVCDPDNAATELIAEGENGYVVPSAAPEDLASAIVRVHEAGDSLRRSTVDWFRRNAKRLSLDSSLETVIRAYRGGGS
jgi:glycosyltransferase involved in cell wall biosynthesis